MANQSARRCVRCGLPLTDPASVENGIGPVCANRDNHLFAIRVKADFREASVAFENIYPDLYKTVELQPRSELVLQELTRFANTPDQDHGQDSRKAVKHIEWILSWTADLMTATVETLHKVVEHLGYLGIVALWRGETSFGEASIVMRDGQFVIDGPKNWSVIRLCKEFRGKWNPVQKVWTVPVTQQSRERIQRTRYLYIHPTYSTLLDTALERAAEHLAAQLQSITEVPTPASQPPALPAATYLLNGEQMILWSPYNADYVALIKRIKPARRWWDDEQKAWRFIGAQTCEWALNVARRFFTITYKE